jgi:hypothetical protein
MSQSHYVFQLVTVDFEKMMIQLVQYYAPFQAPSCKIGSVLEVKSVESFGNSATARAGLIVYVSMKSEGMLF